MFAFIAWYLTISLAGWVAFPLAFRLLRFLPDRGYTLARALGWLVWGYLFWLGTSFGITANNSGGLILALLVVGGVSLYFAGGKSGLVEIREWLIKQRRLVISTEILFLAAFALWALIRAMMPEISGTEKPMELAFINAILASPQFPPHDPWLSGYAISYYYFGYVLIAMVARLTGTAAGMAFNLGIALLFSLTAVGAYGLLYNLLAIRKARKLDRESKGGLYTLPLFGPVFLLLVSNIEGFFEILHARGIFWQQNFDGTWESGFWKWLGILELNQPPSLPYSWIPNRLGGVVWWRASRVLADYGYDGSFREVIDEFPFFSYLLGDMHPHVLAMPFALLAIGLALNLYLDQQPGEFKLWRLHIPLSPVIFLTAGVVLGAMGFLNTWDFPIYIALFCGAFVLGRSRRAGWRFSLVGDFLRLGLALGVTGVLLYLPFYIGFSSQAGGILPSLIFFTKGTQYWVMFAPLLVPILAWLVYAIKTDRHAVSIGRGLRYAGLLIGGLWAGSYLFSGLINLSERARGLFLSNQGMTSQELGPLLLEATLERLRAPGAWLTLILLLGLTLAVLLSRPRQAEGLDNPEITAPVATAGNVVVEFPGGKRLVEQPTNPGEAGFVLLLILAGGLLTLAPEYFYLMDQFGGRMNTVFKFYFQAWLVWSIAAAYGTSVLLLEVKRIPGMVLRAGLFIILLMGLAYAPMMLAERTNGFSPPNGLTLDGLDAFRRYNPDEAAAITWLQTAPAGVVAEAIGGQYSAYARIATQTGQPNVLGWPGHESQWRGSDEAFASRVSEVERLYSSADWLETEAILERYSIRHIVVGGLERSTYRVYEQKFQDHLQQVFQQGSVTIYEVPGQAGLISKTGQRQ